MKPIANKAVWKLVEQSSGCFLENLTDGRRLEVDALAAEAWRLSDGTRGVAELSAELGRSLQRNVAIHEVGTALDWLADASALEGRVSPPTGEHLVSRRQALGRSLSIPAVAAAALVAVPVFGQQEQSNKEAAAKRDERQEQHAKEIDQQQEARRKEHDQDQEQKRKKHEEERMKQNP